MSKVSEFYDAFSKDEAMQARASARIDAVLGTGEGKQGKNEAIVAFAAEEGYAFTEDDLKDFTGRGELSDEDLKAIAGGVDAGTMSPTSANKAPAVSICGG